MIPHFEAAATELIEAKGAVQALAAALARLTNQHGAIKVEEEKKNDCVLTRAIDSKLAGLAY